VDSVAEKEVIRIAFPYLDFFIVQAEGEQLRISVFWSSRKPEFCGRNGLFVILVARADCLLNSAYLLTKTDLNKDKP